MIQNNLSMRCGYYIVYFFFHLLYSLSNSMKVRILIIFNGYASEPKLNLRRKIAKPKIIGIWRRQRRAHYKYFHIIFIQIEVQHYYRFICYLTSTKCQVELGFKLIVLEYMKKSFKFVKYDHDFISNWAIKLNQIKNVKKTSYGFVFGLTCIGEGLALNVKNMKIIPFMFFYALRVFSVDSAFAN